MRPRNDLDSWSCDSDGMRKTGSIEAKRRKNNRGNSLSHVCQITHDILTASDRIGSSGVSVGLARSGFRNNLMDSSRTKLART
jgi:hypothetical protein